MEKLNINVKGMHCKSCETLLKDSLEELDGVKVLDISHNKCFVVVEYGKKAGINAIIAAIKKEGYEVVQ